MITLNLILPDLNFTTADVRTTFEMLDADKTGLLTYSQFLIATLDPELLTDETLLRYNFNDLDSLKEGFLTKQSLLIAFQRKGIEINEKTILDEFKRQSLQENVHIDFELFKRIR